MYTDYIEAESKEAAIEKFKRTSNQDMERESFPMPNLEVINLQERDDDYEMQQYCQDLDAKEREDVE
jgi:cell division protein FtsX